MTEPSPAPEPGEAPELDPTEPAAPEPAATAAPHANGGRRMLIVLVGVVVAFGVLVALLQLPSRDASADLDSYSLTELHEMTQERVEGLRGLVDIASVTHDTAAGSVFDETERDALAEQERLARELLRGIDDDGGRVASSDKVAVVEEYKRISVQIGGLFEAIRDVQDAVDLYEEAHAAG